jgi:predicted transcriptional regulator
MASVAESRKLVDGIVRLRRAERIPAAAEDIAPVRRDLELRLGPTLSRSRTAQILGVSQTALDRWVRARQVPIVLTPHGRREVPRQFVVELREAIDELLNAGQRRHLLAQALERRREAAAELGRGAGLGETAKRRGPAGHGTAARRGLAFHVLIAERLDRGMVEEAQDRVERLASEGHLHPRYAERWRALLVRPLAEISEVIVADTQEARDLRQNSPFAGVLNEQERRRVIETIR